MSTEFDKVFGKLGVTLKFREHAGTPARGFTLGSRCWRVSLERNVKGADKPLRLSVTMFAPDEPTPSQVVLCLANDVAAGELSLWDFAQSFNKGNTDKQTEHMHATCKRFGPRVKRFFGEGWAKLAASAPKAA
jgi:hypothetical protein